MADRHIAPLGFVYYGIAEMATGFVNPRKPTNNSHPLPHFDYTLKCKQVRGHLRI